MAAEVSFPFWDVTPELDVDEFRKIPHPDLVAARCFHQWNCAIFDRRFAFCIRSVVDLATDLMQNAKCVPLAEAFCIGSCECTYRRLNCK